MPKLVTGDILNQTSITAIDKYISKEIGTTYGNTCEDHGLRVYESATGFTVDHRNDQYLLLPLCSRACETVSVSGVSGVNGSSERRSDGPCLSPPYHLGPLCGSFIKHKTELTIETHITKQTNQYCRHILKHMLVSIFHLAQEGTSPLVPPALDDQRLSEIFPRPAEPFSYYCSRRLVRRCRGSPRVREQAGREE